MNRSVNAVFERGYDEVVKTARVHQDNGAEIQSQTLQGDRFKKFFQRAATAGESHGSVSAREHQVLAFAHVLDNAKFGQPLVAPFQIHHETWYDSDCRPAGTERSFRKPRHGAGSASPINQRRLMACQMAAQALRGVKIGRVALFARGAIDAYFQVAHFKDPFPQNPSSSRKGQSVTPRRSPGALAKFSNQGLQRIAILKDADSGYSRRAILEADGRAVDRDSAQRKDRDRNLRRHFAEFCESERRTVGKLGRSRENRP